MDINISSMIGVALVLYVISYPSPKEEGFNNFDYEKRPGQLNEIYLYIKKKNYKLNDMESIKIADAILTYSKEFDLDPKLLTSLINKESSFNRHAISSAGAKGLGQIKDFNKPLLDIKDSFDIQQNTRGTAKFLKRMINIWTNKRDSVKWGLASYFKGRGTVYRYGVDDEAKKYIADILRFYEEI